MRVEIDRNRCESYGVCVQSAPDIFALDDEGDSVVLTPEVTDEMTSGAAMAERSCPMQAVRLS